MDANITTFAFRPIIAGKTERFLSVFVPYKRPANAVSLARLIKTNIDSQGVSTAEINGTKVRIESLKHWSVTRQH